jgi:hypothetical protein
MAPWSEELLMLRSHQRRMPPFKLASKAPSFKKKYHDILTYVTLDTIGYTLLKFWKCYTH